MSSYRKMKEKYEKQIAYLTKDIVTLIEGAPLDRMMVKIVWKAKLDIERTMWKGDTNTNEL